MPYGLTLVAMRVGADLLHCERAFRALPTPKRRRRGACPLRRSTLMRTRCRALPQSTAAGRPSSATCPKRTRVSEKVKNASEFVNLGGR
jgi:hypothetical protein